jgi:hypothetical protein
LVEPARLKVGSRVAAVALVKAPPASLFAKRSLPAPQPVPAAKPGAPQRPLWTKSLSEAQIGQRLRQVPEVALDEAKGPAASVQQARERIQGQIEDAKAQTGKHLDEFVAHLEKTRPDLAGLPFRKGRECVLEKEPARALAHHSLTIRSALADASTVSFSGARAAMLSRPNLGLFWSVVSPQTSRNKPQVGKLPLGPLQQMLPAEHPDYRLSMVHLLRGIEGKEASVLLTRWVLFDSDTEVRSHALAALSARPRAEFADELLEGLRHPWAPAAGRAAEALATLRLKDVVPRLVSLLDGPDPGDPFLTKADGKEVPAVRELVRINHLRNCLLCHAPAENGRGVVRGEIPVGAIPVPGEPLPPPVAYYGGGGRSLFVRADVTYLRQDFSALLRVENPGRWPDLQRFDYLVRIRPLTEAEQMSWKFRQCQLGPQQPSAHRQAVLFALCALTGQDVGDSPEAWRRLLQAPDADAAWRAPSAASPRRGLGSRPCAR